jgi:hypothetical protein
MRIHRANLSTSDKEKLRRQSGQAPTASVTPGDIAQLQRTMGNRAAARLLRGVSSAPSGMIQTAKKHRKKKYRKKSGSGKPMTQEQQLILEKIQAGEQKRAQEKAQQNSWSAWFWSWTNYDDPTEEEDETVDLLQYENHKVGEGEGGGYLSELDLGDKQDENPSDGGEVKNPFAIEQLEINLAQGKVDKKDTSIGDIKGSGKQGITTEGVKYSGKGKIEGSKGKLEGEGSLLTNDKEFKGEGKVGFLLGASSEQKSGTLRWGSKENSVQGSGEMETKVGLSGDVALKLAMNAQKFAAQGKAGGFVGVGTEGKVKLKIVSEGQDLGTAEGKLGIAYGAGGEISGSIDWEGGKFSFSTSGKLVAGIGFSYGYKFEINTQAIAKQGFFQTLKSWLWW